MPETKWIVELNCKPRTIQGYEIWEDGMLVAVVAGLADFDFRNAHKIAAVPDMHESLDSIVHLLRRRWAEMDGDTAQIEAALLMPERALAKARGEATP